SADPDVVAGLLPPGMEPKGDGSASFVFADWCSASDADPRIRDDPGRGQYKEAYVVLYGTYAGKPAGRVPFIWVDNDLSLVRGLIQGFPKKLGTIAMTRPVELGRGGVRKEAGSRFAAHVSSQGRRLCSAAVTLTDEHDKLYPPGIATPLVHTRLWPSIDGGPPAVHELSRGTISDFELGRVYSGDATIELGMSEFEELDLLSPRAVGRGYVFAAAFSVTGGTAIPISE
ncbi:MAG TPA: acetoacetate decarboxylase family protein, partial [Acidimicrobiia bacterium]